MDLQQQALRQRVILQNRMLPHISQLPYPEAFDLWYEDEPLGCLGACTVRVFHAPEMLTIASREVFMLECFQLQALEGNPTGWIRLPKDFYLIFYPYPLPAYPEGFTGLRRQHDHQVQRIWPGLPSLRHRPDKIKKGEQPQSIVTPRDVWKLYRPSITPQLGGGFLFEQAWEERSGQQLALDDILHLRWELLDLGQGRCFRPLRSLDAYWAEEWTRLRERYHLRMDFTPPIEEWQALWLVPSYYEVLDPDHPRWRLEGFCLQPCYTQDNVQPCPPPPEDGDTFPSLHLDDLPWRSLPPNAVLAYDLLEQRTWLLQQEDERLVPMASPMKGLPALHYVRERGSDDRPLQLLVGTFQLANGSYVLPLRQLMGYLSWDPVVPPVVHQLLLGNPEQGFASLDLCKLQYKKPRAIWEDIWGLDDEEDDKDPLLGLTDDTPADEFDEDDLSFLDEPEDENDNEDEDDDEPIS